MFRGVTMPLQVHDLSPSLNARASRTAPQSAPEPWEAVESIAHRHRHHAPSTPKKAAAVGPPISALVGAAGWLPPVSTLQLVVQPSATSGGLTALAFHLAVRVVVALKIWMFPIMPKHPL